MRYFDLLFPLVMILSPLIFAVFIRTRPDPGEPDAEAAAARIAALRRRLWIGTAAAVIAFLAVHLFINPRWAYFLWMLVFPLWFSGAMPLLQAKDRGWRPIPRPPARAATLERRDLVPPGLAVARLLTWALWLALFGLAIWPFARGVTGWSTSWFLMFSLFGAGWLVMGRYATRLSTLEPEPLDVAGSEELTRGYERLRHFKVWGWFALSTMAMLAFCLPPILLARDPVGLLTAAIWVGAGGGSFVGLLGGVFGTMADLQRTRLNRLYQDLSREGTA